MIARASRFAAPLVLIVGCGQPPAPDEPWVERDPEPPTVRRVRRAADAGAEVAAALVPVDAWPAPDPFAISPCDRPLHPDNPTCNPPRSRPRVIAKVIDIDDHDGGGVLVTISAGAADGVEKGWRGKLLDDSGNVVKGSNFVILKVTNQAALAKVKLSRADISATTVQLEPP